MSETIINQTDVKKINDPVQNAVDRIPTNPKLSKFQTADGPFGWFAHGVTGTELNRFVNDIQQYLIEAHENNIELRDKYDQLIQDLNVFDKRYLEANVNAVKSAEKACEEARAASKTIDHIVAQEISKAMGPIIDENKHLQKKVWIATLIACNSIVISIALIILHFILS